MKQSYSVNEHEERDVVLVGERFTLFAHVQRRKYKTRKYQLPELCRSIMLVGSDVLPAFSLTIWAIDYRDRERETIRTFLPSGTNRSAQHADNQLLAQNPYRLHVGASSDDLCDSGIGSNSCPDRQERASWEPLIHPAFLPLLYRLRLQVGTTDGERAYEAMPSVEALAVCGELFFAVFSLLTPGKPDPGQVRQAVPTTPCPLHVSADPVMQHLLWGRFTLAG